MKITAIWLLKLEDNAIVRIEVDGKWCEIIREHVDGPFSHICEEAGIEHAVQGGNEVKL